MEPSVIAEFRRIFYTYVVFMYAMCGHDNRQH